VAAPLNIGIANASRRTPDLPLHRLRNKATCATVQTTDPGPALITGKWADISKFKGPILRGLAARAPYFHNRSAVTLDDVVDFYNTRFGIGLTAQAHTDLVAFLRSCKPLLMSIGEAMTERIRGSLRSVDEIQPSNAVVQQCRPCLGFTP
jgi:hypothetical protein